MVSVGRRSSRVASNNPIGRPASPPGPRAAAGASAHRRCARGSSSRALGRIDFADMTILSTAGRPIRRERVRSSAEPLPAPRRGMPRVGKSRRMHIVHVLNYCQLREGRKRPLTPPDTYDAPQGRPRYGCARRIRLCADLPQDGYVAVPCRGIAALIRPRSAACPTLGCVFPPDQTDFIAGQVFDVRIEAQAPANGSAPFNGGVSALDDGGSR